MHRQDFEQLVDEHRQLIRLTNELEFQLYRLGEAGTPEHVSACQQAAGNLIGKLRISLVRHDQEVFPVLESLIGASD
jgi:hypothetical protein